MDALAFLRLPAGKRASLRQRADGGEPGHPLHAALERAAQEEGFELERTFAQQPGERRHAAYEALLRHLSEPPAGQLGAPQRFRVLFIPDWQHLDQQPLRAAERLLEVEAHGLIVRSLADEDPLAAALGAWEAWHQRRGAQVRQGMERRAVQGLGLGRPPYGYRIGENGHFEVVESEAQTVRLMYRLYVRSRLGLRRIAAEINDEGRQTRHGRPWSIVSIRTILRNRAYLGTYDRFGFRVLSAHAAMISPEEYRLVQERLGRFSLAGIAPQPSVFLLSDLARCGFCGNTMMGVSRKQRWQRRTGERREQVYRYYQCQSRRNLSLCQYRTRRAVQLEAMVFAELRRLQHRLPPPSLLKRPTPPVSNRERLQVLRATAQGLASLKELRVRAQEWFHPLGARLVGRSWEQQLMAWESLPYSHQRSLLLALLTSVVVRENGIELELREPAGA